MQVDHIFIFSNDKGQEADELVNFGLAEGSSRAHPGQGTTNRKFYFENFFLEVLWVHDRKELINGPARSIGLQELSQFVKRGNSRYGLCLVNTPETDQLFSKSISYQPDYFPGGKSIDVLTHQQSTSLPWTFRLPFRGGKKAPTEPTNHYAGIRKLTRAEFGISHSGMGDSFVDIFKNSQQVSFKVSDHPRLTLEFDNCSQGKTFECPQLSLLLKY